MGCHIRFKGVFFILLCQCFKPLFNSNKGLLHKIKINILFYNLLFCPITNLIKELFATFSCCVINAIGSSQIEILQNNQYSGKSLLMR